MGKREFIISAKGDTRQEENVLPCTQNKGLGVGWGCSFKWEKKGIGSRVTLYFDLATLKCCHHLCMALLF